MPAWLLSEWLAYAELEPFGEFRDDVRAAIIASTVANMLRGRKQKAFSISDFMLKFDEPKKQQKDWRVMKAQMRAFFDGK
jgi:hypothetical protein